MPAIIELSIRRLPDDSTTAELRAYQRSMTVLAPSQPVTINSTTLLSLSSQHTAYGVALAEMVFSGPLKEAWARARGHAEGGGAGVHLRVLIDDHTGALHALRWELLRDPATNASLAQQEGGSLARTVVSDSLHDPDPPVKPKLRALVAVAGPSDGQQRFGLAPVDVAGEAARVQEALGEITTGLLVSDAPESRGLATLENIKNGLRAEAHLLYLVCHGRQTDKGTTLYLVGDDGKAAPIIGDTLAAAIRDLDVAHCPLLAVLVACEGGSQEDAPLASVGPLLARVGIPAVIAMQAMISMSAVAQFTARMIHELRSDGRIDRALAAARKELGDEWWVPVLWLRARGGRLWEERGQAADPLALLATMPTEANAPIPAADSFAATLHPIPHRLPLLPSELFVGRDDDLRELAATIKAGGSAVITHGMGGVGKTQLAIELAHRYGRFFAGGVFWLDASEPERIPDEIAACGGSDGLNLPGFDELSLADQVRQVRVAWQESTPRLIIFDNCEDEALLRQYRPPAGGCRLLVTSRRQEWHAGQGLTLHELEMLSRLASITLLQQLYPALDVDTAAQIAEMFGDLPLALHLAGSFLAAYPSVAPSAFLGDVQIRRLEHPALIGRGDPFVPTYTPLGREVNLFAVFKLSLDRIDPATLAGTLARTLLAFVARLEPPGTTFPRALLAAIAPIDQIDPDATLLVDEAISLLNNQGLLEQQAGERLRMHRLIRDAVKQAQVEPEAFAYCAPSALRFYVNLIGHANQQLIRGEIVDGRRLINEEQHLWQQFLDWGYDHEIGTNDVSDTARATAQLLNYWMLVDAQGQSETLKRLERALGVAQRVHDHFGEASVLRAMGEVQRFHTKMDEALFSYQTARSLFRHMGEQLGEASVLRGIGEVYLFREEMDAALASYQQARLLYRQLGDYIGEATVLRGMGEVQQFHNDHNGALDSYQAALDLYRQAGNRFGEANVLAAQGQLALINGAQFEADRHLAQAIAIYETIGNRWNVAAQTANYGLALLRIDRHEDARPYLLRAADLFAAIGFDDRAQQHRRLATELPG